MKSIGMDAWYSTNGSVDQTVQVESSCDKRREHKEYDQMQIVNHYVS